LRAGISDLHKFYITGQRPVSHAVFGGDMLTNCTCNQSPRWFPRSCHLPHDDVRDESAEVRRALGNV